LSTEVLQLEESLCKAQEQFKYLQPLQQRKEKKRKEKKRKERKKK
jgi:hypothetical protein